MVDFSNITACGGNCSGCEHFLSKECEGCNQGGGKCSKMWDNGCEIYACCQRHNVRFCGLCEGFPCEWLKKTMTWEEGLIERLGEIREEYLKGMESFSPYLSELWKKIGSHGVMTLSTCDESRVTSRPMSIVVIDGRFYCQTGEDYLKCRQIRSNPNVAVCLRNFSVEGSCRIIGKPFQFDFFIQSMKAHFSNAVERWSSLSTECVLEITPHLIYSWDYEEENGILKPYMEYWDFRALSYKKVSIITG